MPTEMERITVSLGEDDYQWVAKNAEIAATSKSGIIRQLVRAVRTGRPGLLDLGQDGMYYAESSDEKEGDEAHGLDAFQRN